MADSWAGHLHSVAMSSMDVITQAFAGHLGEVELAAMMIASATIVGFNVGLLVIHRDSFVSMLALLDENSFVSVCRFHIFSRLCSRSSVKSRWWSVLVPWHLKLSHLWSISSRPNPAWPNMYFQIRETWLHCTFLASVQFKIELNLKHTICIKSPAI